jgi:hypothetical protein
LEKDLPATGVARRTGGSGGRPRAIRCALVSKNVALIEDAAAARTSTIVSFMLQNYPKWRPKARMSGYDISRVSLYRFFGRRHSTEGRLRKRSSR